jgi:lysozyme
MTITNAISIATQFLKQVESCKLVGYGDSAGNPTDGYGNRIGARIGAAISQEKADLDLICNIKTALQSLSDAIHPDENNLNLYTDNQIAALISFVFNCGAGNWQIWNCVSNHDIAGIKQQMARFDHIRKNGKIEVCPGLDNRRKAEIALFNNNQIVSTNIVAILPVANDNGHPVEPKPDPTIQQQANVGLQTVAVATVVSSVAVAGKAIQFNLAPYLIGFSLGCVLCLAIGLFLYYRELKLPRSIPEQSGLVYPTWINNLMATSQAFQDALAAMVAAFNAQQAKAVADATTAAQTALNNAVANATAQADTDAVAAVVAATPQAQG